MTFESISGDGENSTQTSGGISRRSVIKVGAHAAWAVPLVQVVAAAPAIAVSQAPVLSFSSFAANYGIAAGPTQNDPSHVFVTAVVRNDGHQTTSGLQVTLTLPANAYGAAPTVTTSAGWSASPAGGSASTGWTIVLTLTAQLAGGTSSPTLTATLTLNDSATVRNVDGWGFDLTGTAHATNAGAVDGSVTLHVKATPDTTINITGFAGSYATQGTKAILVRGATVVNAGTVSSAGVVTFVVTIPKGTGRLASPPSNPTAVPSGWSFTGSDRATSNNNWTYTFVSTNKVLPGSSTPVLNADFALTGTGNQNQVTITAKATATHAPAAGPVPSTFS